MTNRLKKCRNCFRYTLDKETCPICQSSVKNIHPPKFSLQDKYQKYRMDYFRKKMLKKYPDLKKSMN